MKTIVVRDLSKNLEPVIVDDARTVVVNDDFNQPIVVIQMLAQGKYLVSKAGDSDFQKILRSSGLNLNTKYVTTRSTL